MRDNIARTERTKKTQKKRMGRSMMVMMMLVMMVVVRVDGGDDRGRIRIHMGRLRETFFILGCPTVVMVVMMMVMW